MDPSVKRFKIKVGFKHIIICVYFNEGATGQSSRPQYVVIHILYNHPDSCVV